MRPNGTCRSIEVVLVACRSCCPCRRSCSCRRPAPGPAGSGVAGRPPSSRWRIASAALSHTTIDRGRRRTPGVEQLGVGVVDVVAGAVGEDGVDRGGSRPRAASCPRRRSRGRRCRAARPRSPSRPCGAGAPRQLADVGVDQDRRRRDRVRRRPRRGTMPYSVSIADRPCRIATTGALRGRQATAGARPRREPARSQRYWPVRPARWRGRRASSSACS